MRCSPMIFSALFTSSLMSCALAQEAPEKPKVPTTQSAKGGLPTTRAAKVTLVFPWNADLTDTQRATIIRAVNGLLESLDENQKFNLVMFGLEDGVRALDAYRLRPATAENKTIARIWLEAASPRVGDPLASLRFALAQEPDVLYLIADRDYVGRQLIPAIRDQRWKRKVIVNSASTGPAGDFEQILRKVAEDSAGHFIHLAEPAK